MNAICAALQIKVPTFTSLQPSVMKNFQSKMPDLVGQRRVSWCGRTKRDIFTFFFSPNRPYLPFLRRAGKQRFTLDVWDKCIKLACPTCCSPRGWLFHKINDTMTQKMNFCPLKGHWTLLNKDTEYEECIQKLFKVPLNWVRFVFLCLLWTLGQTLGHTHRLTVLAAATRSPGFG